MPKVDSTFDVLREKMTRALTHASLDGELRSVRVSEPAPLDAIEVLRATSDDSLRWYWASRKHGYEQVGWDVADVISASDEYRAVQAVSERLDNLGAGARFVGGFRFDTGASSADEWEDYGRARFWLPRFSLRRKDGRWTLSCHVREGERAEVIQMLKRMNVPSKPRKVETPGYIVDRRDLPAHDGWLTQVQNALEQIKKKTYRKVVLARRSTFSFDEQIPPVGLLASLRDDTPGCFHFFLSQDATYAFLGASPERLLRLDGRCLISESVAGTRPRSGSNSWDAVLQQELMASEKDRLEHLHVQQFVARTFEKLCREVDGDDEPSSMALKRGRHLHANIRGTLRPKITLADVVKRLHPTPAVAGLPVDASMRDLRIREPFDRGWYAGGIGWIEKDAAEFAVGIRSALVSGQQLNLYAGAGIVPGSHPEQEWKEVEHKISDYLALFQEASAI